MADVINTKLIRQCHKMGLIHDEVINEVIDFFFEYDPFGVLDYYEGTPDELRTKPELKEKLAEIRQEAIDALTGDNYLIDCIDLYEKEQEA